MEPGIDLLDPAANRLALDICELSAHISAASAELAAKAARFDESGGWGEGGIRSCAEFLSQEAGLDLHTGHDLLRVGRALNSLPKLAAACAAGELSYDKARAVATVATPEDEAIFVDLALQLTGSQLVRFCHAYRRAMLAAEPDHDAGHQARRSLEQTWREDGMVRLVALLPPEDGATVIAAINAITGGRPVPEQDPAEDRWAANRAEALVTICEHALATAPEDLASSPASRRLVVNVDVGVLAGEQPDGRCELEGGHPLSRDAALRLGCDADVIAVTTRNGLPIDVGRTTRVIPHRLRTALAARDRGCRYPGCGIPARRTEGHHLEHWARGGATTLDNLLSFCRFHHGRHHKGDFAVTKVGPNEFRFTTRDGREIVPRHTRVDPDTGGGNRLRATAHSRGIPITPYTPAARDGSNLDLAWATSIIADGCEYLHAHGHHPDVVAASR